MAASTDTVPAGASTAKPRLQQRYEDEIREKLKADLELGNIMEVPRLSKIVLNCGVGAATDQKSLIDGAVADLTVIAVGNAIIALTQQPVNHAEYKGCSRQRGDLQAERILQPHTEDQVDKFVARARPQRDRDPGEGGDVRQHSAEIAA